VQSSSPRRVAGGGRKTNSHHPAPTGHPSSGRRGEKYATVAQSSHLELVGQDQDFSRNPEAVVEAPDHLNGQRTFAVQDLRYLGTAAEVGLDILAGQPSAFHEVEDGLDGIRRKYGVVFLLVDLHERSQYIQPVAILRPRLCLEQTFDLRKSRLVITLRGAYPDFCVPRS
jgi:hypothetical protein